MTSLTDDQLGDLLSGTFHDHEHLADPDRAIALAAAPRSRPHHVGRAVLGAAAAVALVAGGATYGLTRGSGRVSPDAGPSTPTSASHLPEPPLPPLQTDAENRSRAASAARDLAGRLPVFPGARRSGRIAALDTLGLMTSGPPHNTVTNTRWLTVSGAAPQAVAHWYAAHPPQGFRSPGGVSSSSTSAPGTPTLTAYAADYSRPSSAGLPPHGISAEIETMAVPGGTAIRATVLSIWAPARPRPSYVQDVRSIDVRIVATRYGTAPHSTHRSFTIGDPARVLRIATVFDSLPGAPEYVLSCPMIVKVTTYRIVFHTGTGIVTARYTNDICSTGMGVSRDGHPVGPALGDASRLLPLLRP